VRRAARPAARDAMGRGREPGCDSLRFMTAFAEYGSATALEWSLMAMNDATDRVNKIAASDLPGAFAAIGEAVWWITIVNDTLRHNHPAAYQQAAGLTSPDPADTINGLRSVRNRIGHKVDLVDFICPVAAREWSADGRITAWAWKPVPPPDQSDRTGRQHKRDLELHHGYTSALADRNIWQPFMLATGFFGQVFRVLGGEIGTV
jgi:hypothetical protein